MFSPKHTHSLTAAIVGLTLASIAPMDPAQAFAFAEVGDASNSFASAQIIPTPAVLPSANTIDGSFLTSSDRDIFGINLLTNVPVAVLVPTATATGSYFPLIQVFQETSPGVFDPILNTFTGNSNASFAFVGSLTAGLHYIQLTNLVLPVPGGTPAFPATYSVSANYVNAIPEPLTILGSIAALGAGGLIQRKQARKQARKGKSAEG